MQQNNLKLILRKCKFRNKEVHYVGHKISQKELEADNEKVRTDQYMVRPQNKKEASACLSFITYL